MSHNFDDYDDSDDEQAAKEAELLAKVRQIKTIKVHGHCVDRSQIRAKDANGKVLFDPEPDYMKSSLGLGGGDDISFEVDIETGQIVGWKRPTDDDLCEAFDPDQR
jgi:hypothetical protein